MHEKKKYRHIPWNRYNLEKYRDIDFWSYRPALAVPHQGSQKSLARRPGAIALSSQATNMYHCPARRATLNIGLPQIIFLDQCEYRPMFLYSKLL